MKKKQIEKEDFRNDLTVYQIAFWVTISCFLIFIGVVLFSSNHKIETDCNPCDYILSTPSWLINNKIVGVGYIPNLTTELMMENNITLIYSDSCGVCTKQKENLDMNLLNMRGLVLKC